MFVVIQTRVQLCDRQLPLIQMILLLIFLLASLLQQYGTEAESSDVSKLQLSSIKEPNGKLVFLKVINVLVALQLSHTDMAKDYFFTWL